MSKRAIPSRPGTRHDDGVATRVRARAGWALAATSTVVAVAAMVGGFGTGQLPFTIDGIYPNAVWAVLFPVVGALILARVPGHRLGWLYCFSGLACALTLAAISYAQYTLVAHPGALPAGVAVGWVSSWIWACGFSPLATFGVLLFPDGHLPSRRWWPVAALAAVGVGMLVFAAAFAPGCSTPPRASSRSSPR
jgi:hypothetical protein